MFNVESTFGSFEESPFLYLLLAPQCVLSCICVALWDDWMQLALPCLWPMYFHEQQIAQGSALSHRVTSHGLCLFTANPPRQTPLMKLFRKPWKQVRA